MVHQFQTIQSLCYTMGQYIKSFSYIPSLNLSQYSPPAVSRFSRAYIWITKAKRQLKGSEVLDAVTSDHFIEQGRRHDDYFPQTIDDLLVDCWGFLKIDENGMVELLHPELFDRLLVGNTNCLKDHTSSWRADEEIARSCLSHISRHSPPCLIRAVKPQNHDLRKCHNAGRGVCTYAFQFWHLHYRDAESKSHVLPRMLHDMLQSSLSLLPSPPNEKPWESSVDHLNRGLLFSAQHDFEILARTYLEMGADPDSLPSILEPTPLQIAVANSASNMMEFLLKRGAKVDAVDCIGRTALHIAASVGFYEGARRLIEEGANVNSATHLSLSLNHVHSCSSTNTSDENDPEDCIFIGDGTTDEDFPIPTGGGFPPTPNTMEAFPIDLGLATQVRSLTPLHMAAKSGQRGIIELLLSRGADINIKTMDEDSVPGMTALDIAEAEDTKNEDMINLLKGFDSSFRHPAARSANFAASNKDRERNAFLPSRSTRRVIQWLCWEDDLSQTSCETSSCNRCNRTFRGRTRRSNLKRHLETIHFGKVYPCTFGQCHTSFRRRDALKRHIASVHFVNAAAPMPPR